MSRLHCRPGLKVGLNGLNLDRRNSRSKSFRPDLKGRESEDKSKQKWRLIFITQLELRNLRQNKENRVVRNNILFKK